MNCKLNEGDSSTTLDLLRSGSYVRYVEYNRFEFRIPKKD